MNSLLHPCLQDLPEEIQPQVRAAMHQAVRQATLTQLAQHITIEETNEGRGMRFTAHLHLPEPEPVTWDGTGERPITTEGHRLIITTAPGEVTTTPTTWRTTRPIPIPDLPITRNTTTYLKLPNGREVTGRIKLNPDNTIEGHSQQ